MILALLAPSGFNGTVAIVFAASLFFGSVILTTYRDILPLGMQASYVLYQHSSLGPAARAISLRIAQNRLLSSSPLFIFWSLVGLVCYSFVMTLLRGVDNATHVAQEFGYVHSVRSKLVKDIALRTAIRVSALVAWVFLFHFLLYTLIPYTIATAQLSATNAGNWAAWGRGLLAVGGLVCGLHVLTVLLRLMVLRPRLIHSDVIV